MKTIYNKLAAAVLGFGLIAGSGHVIQYVYPYTQEYHIHPLENL